MHIVYTLRYDTSGVLSWEEGPNFNVVFTNGNE